MVNDVIYTNIDTDCYAKLNLFGVLQRHGLSFLTYKIIFLHFKIIQKIQIILEQ